MYQILIQLSRNPSDLMQATRSKNKILHFRINYIYIYIHNMNIYHTVYLFTAEWTDFTVVCNPQ